MNTSHDIFCLGNEMIFWGKRDSTDQSRGTGWRLPLELYTEAG